MIYAEALASTHLFHAAPTWPPLNRTLRGESRTAHARVYRTDIHVGDANSEVTHVVHTDLLASAGRLPWHDVVTAARLRYFHRLLHQGPLALRVFVDVM